ncbi:hypothetical protein CMK13_07340 [Candidatus Poribacteria bacterium]|nr:hypothetical protein [Candidatus Poribacteria bacterium]OUT63122.1 MAG: hypothetical protein CBB75_06815 [bacterium TMED15]
MNIQVTDNQLIDSAIVGLDVKEYARVFSVSEKTVRIRIREKKVNCYKQNQKWVIRVDRNEITISSNKLDNQLISEIDSFNGLRPKDDHR